METGKTDKRCRRLDIKAILADPVLSEALKEGAVDFICKAEGIRSTPESLANLEQSNNEDTHDR